MKKSWYIYFYSMCLVLQSCSDNRPLFNQLTLDQTGIDFENTIFENDTFNILVFEYVYNGGGVALGDFNKDGLDDVFFSGNMVNNRLYLNKGKMHFEDVTTKAGVALENRWNSGVAVLDINLDGLPDIYVCATTYNPGSRRSNSLFINQGVGNDGIPTFLDKASDYGVADTTHTTNAAFFDYDNDGDLDLFLVVNEMDDERLPNRFRKKIMDGRSKRTDRLYRNDWNAELDHPVFTDVSVEAGILIEGYGLGVNICDINRDGWKDIYITNDYITNDLFYINNGDGTFTDKAKYYFKHTCHSAMGNDVADINNDGLVDIIAVDMLPEDNYRRKTMLPANNYTTYINNQRFNYQTQYVRNVLQLNQGKRPDNGELLFSDIGMLSGISATDWSWAPMIADFDNDGYRDIIITNGFPKDVTDRDFMDYQANTAAYASNEFMLKRIPSVKINNYAYRNKGDLSFEKVSESWGIHEASFSNGAAYGDLDNDGDLDYIVNNINSPAFVYENNLNPKKKEKANWLGIKLKGTKDNPEGFGAFIQIFYGDNQKQVWEHTLSRGYLSSIQNRIHFGLGAANQVKRILINWPNGKLQELKDFVANKDYLIDIKDAPTATLAASKEENNPLIPEVTKQLIDSFIHPEKDYIDFNIQPLLPHKLSQYGPGIAVADVNGDGLDDFYLGGSHFFKGQLFIQQVDGRFTKMDLLPGKNDEKGEELGVLFFDADGDGDQDLYAVHGGFEFNWQDSSYQDQLFLNEKGRFHPAVGALPDMKGSGSCVKAADFDRDGDLDLFVGGRVFPHEYPKPVTSYILRNESTKGKLKFSVVNETVAPELKEIGLVCDALWTDFDNDGWVDLMLAGEWMPLYFLRNEDGVFSSITNQTTIQNKIGWWNSLVGGDFDKDGDMDYIAGNLGLNTLNRASVGQPVGIYAADFDNNGGYDAIPTLYFNSLEGDKKEFPFYGRSDIEKQMVKVKGKFLRHTDFAKATIKDFLPEILDNKEVLALKANYMETSYIENLGNGKFAMHVLPFEAQFAPVFGMVAQDFNNDSHLDILLSGNDFGTEVGMGRYDALNGLLLLGNGKGRFEPLTMMESGIVIEGDGKSVATLMNNIGEQLILVTQNKGLAKIFKPKHLIRGMKLEPFDFSAVIYLNNGQSYKEEFYYGSSFLSQSARVFNIPQNVEKIEVFDFQGNKREAHLLQ